MKDLDLEVIGKIVLCVLLIGCMSLVLTEFITFILNGPQNAYIGDSVSEPEDRIVLVEWWVWGNNPTCVLDFGDGTQAELSDCETTQATFHTYDKPGGYLVTLRAYSADQTFHFDALPNQPDETQTIPMLVPRENPVFSGAKPTTFRYGGSSREPTCQASLRWREVPTGVHL